MRLVFFILSLFVLKGLLAQQENEFCKIKKLQPINISETRDTLLISYLQEIDEMGRITSDTIEVYYDSSGFRTSRIIVDDVSSPLNNTSNIRTETHNGITFDYFQTNLSLDVDSDPNSNPFGYVSTRSVRVRQTERFLRVYGLPISAYSNNIEVRLRGEVQHAGSSSFYGWGSTDCSIYEDADNVRLPYETESFIYPINEFCSAEHLNFVEPSQSTNEVFLDFTKANTFVGRFDSLLLAVSYFNGLTFDTITFYNQNTDTLDFLQANNFTELIKDTTKNGLTFTFGSNQNETSRYIINGNSFISAQERILFGIQNIPDTAFLYPIEVFYQGSIRTDSTTGFGEKSCEVVEGSQLVDAPVNQFCDSTYLISQNFNSSARTWDFYFIESYDPMGQLVDPKLTFFTEHPTTGKDTVVFYDHAVQNLIFPDSIQNADTATISGIQYKYWKEVDSVSSVVDYTGAVVSSIRTENHFTLLDLTAVNFDFHQELRLSGGVTTYGANGFYLGDCSIDEFARGYEFEQILAPENQLCSIDKQLTLVVDSGFSGPFGSPATVEIEFLYDIPNVGRLKNVTLDLVYFDSLQIDTVRFFDQKAQNLNNNVFGAGFLYNGINYTYTTSNSNTTVGLVNNIGSAVTLTGSKSFIQITDLTKIAFKYDFEVILGGEVINLSTNNSFNKQGCPIYSSDSIGNVLFYESVKVKASESDLCDLNFFLEQEVDLDSGQVSIELLNALSGRGELENVQLSAIFNNNGITDTLQFYDQSTETVAFVQDTIGETTAITGVSYDYHLVQGVPINNISQIRRNNGNSYAINNSNNESADLKRFNLTNLPASAFTDSIFIVISGETRASFNSNFGTSNCLINDGSNNYQKIGVTTLNYSNSGNPNYIGTPNVNTSVAGQFCRRTDINFSAHFSTAFSGLDEEFGIYRNDSLIHISSSSNSYSDFSAEPDVAYNYKVQQRWSLLGDRLGGVDTNDFNRIITSPFSAVRVGISGGPIGNASNVYANTANCSGDIGIFWNYTGSGNPTSFEIERSTDSTFADSITDVFLALGSDRTYRDATSITGVPYFYRMRAELACPGQSVGISFSSWSPTLALIGIGTPPKPQLIDATVDTTKGQITINWIDASTLEDYYKVIRQSATGQVTFDVAANTEQYIDSSVQSCVTYDYRVSAVSNQCAVSGIISDSNLTANVPPKLNQSLTTSDIVSASDGEFGDRVEVRWTFSNGLADNWKVIRINPATADTLLIATVGGSVKFYVDNTADANTIYRYLLYGETTCESTTFYTDTIEDVGFRLAFGTIGGQIAVNGGTAVSNVKLLTQAAAGLNGKSGSFSGSSTSVDAGNPVEFRSVPFTVSAYIKPDDLTLNKQIILHKRSGLSTGFEFGLKKDSLSFTAVGTGEFNVNRADLRSGTWVHVSAVVDTNVIKLYINGNEVLNQPYTRAILVDSANFIIGKGFFGQHYDGKMDEVRFYNRALSEQEIATTYDVFIDPASDGLVGYWRFDEGFGQTAFDYSKKSNGVNNRNHAQISHRFFYNSEIVPESQLAPGAYTKADGTYFIPFIPYVGSGDNFTVIPQLGIHQFNPGTRTVFVSSSNANLSGVDFVDQSSFKVTGRIDYFGTTCPSNNAIILVDGQPIVKNGEVIMSAEDGTFEIDVPIGEHFISVQQNGHTYAQARYPLSGGFHDFQDSLNLPTFYDSTLIKVVGRVAGGGVEAQKTADLGLGKNNIGQARIIFKSQLLNGCNLDTVFTDPLTGEFAIELLPLKYEIPDFSPTTNSSIDFDDNKLLDLSFAPPQQEVIDTIVNDTTYYNSKLDFIHYTAPSLNITDVLGANNFGSDTVVDGSGSNQIKFLINSLGLPYPVFEENKPYAVKIHAYELYYNNDAGQIVDSVPVTEATFEITNNLARQRKAGFSVRPRDNFRGNFDYPFSGGQANITEDVNNANFNFTKTLEVVLKTPNHTVSYLPDNSVSPAGPFRGITFGGQANGTDFVTGGPSLVTMVLRDPPGSESYASWEQGTTTTTSTKISSSEGVADFLQDEIKLGTEFTTGVGYEVTTAIENTASASVTTTNTVGEENELIQETTVQTTVSTSANNEYVGGVADLFYGKAFNIRYGLAQVIKLLDTTDCPNVDCFGNVLTFNGKGYQIAKVNTMFAIPEADSTDFIYTAGTIESAIIPNLEALRNQYLEDSIKYTRILLPSDDNYGLSNDDTLFNGVTGQSPAYISNTVEDSIGPSYIFHGYEFVSDTAMNGDIVEVAIGTDSVWMLNQQVRLWKQTLAENEAEKVNASIAASMPNVTISGGVAFTNSNTTSVTNTSTKSFHLNFEEGALLNLGFEVGGVGFSRQRGLTFNQESQETNSNSLNTTATFTYHLEDVGSFDQLTMDIFDSEEGYGPIFKLKGGKTSCPYEGEEVTQYYNEGTPLNIATIALDQPEINVVNPSIVNIPSDGQGVFQLDLVNNGPENAIYTLKVLEYTNPYGAILKVDGITPNRDFAVPGIDPSNPTNSIRKLLTIEKGPGRIKYENIALVFHSVCQYSAGTANTDDIADTVYISATFLPECTAIEIASPLDLFVANNTFENRVELEISDYDINYDGLNRIGLQYKPSQQSNWIDIPTEWFKDSAAIKALVSPHTDARLIPTSTPSISYNFDLKNLIDQNYQFRAVATCDIIGAAEESQYSEIITGLVDRVNPIVFGSPTPADGVLDPNDDISIQFNETIEAGSLTENNFQITAVVNGTNSSRAVHLELDGTNDYLEIQNGFTFPNNSFTIEFWMKNLNTGSGSQTLVNQGGTGESAFDITLNSSGNIEVTFGGITETSSWTIIDNDWHHITITFDKEIRSLAITDRKGSAKQNSLNTTFNYRSAYAVAGKTYFGAQNNSGSISNYFNGYIDEIRVWSSAKSESAIDLIKDISLSGDEAGLIAYWPLNEGKDTLVRDVARARNLSVNANWKFDPSSLAPSFDGIDDYLVADSAGVLVITEEEDFSLEFWFTTNGGKKMTLLSNGSGRFIATDINETGWAIEMFANNSIHVLNDSVDFEAVTNDFSDGNWHHFALVVNRLANATVYIDGQEQNAINSTSFTGFASPKLVVGARYATIGSTIVETVDQFFEGGIDEVRLWNTALKRKTIEYNQFHKIDGDLFGLKAYYPFEVNSSQTGTTTFSSSLNDFGPQAIPLTAHNGVQVVSESPAIAVPRPTKDIKLTWVVNNDEIVITPQESTASLENVTLNIAVKDIKDLNGNLLQSPQNWIAFVNKNQVLWQDALKEFSKDLNTSLTFDATLVNNGGDAKNYSISGLPTWLSANRTSGSIAPQSTAEVTFTVSSALNIGSYTTDLMLTTDFGYAEKMVVNVEVAKDAPDFSFDINRFAKSMSIVSQIAINNVVSVNENDVLVAYINNEIRGAAELTYVESLDRYIAFLDVYTNIDDSVQFKVWNASRGVLHEEVSPTIYFKENTLLGSLLQPQVFNASDKLQLPIALQSGWNWVSFPLQNDDLRSLPLSLGDLNLQMGDQIKTIGNNTVSTYGGSTTGWGAGLPNGIENEKSYLLKLTHADTLEFRGFVMDPDTVLISVDSGWNRVGYIGTQNLTASAALSNYNATDGDIIKSQRAFSVYSTSLGWVGSLKAFEPTKGYLLNAQRSASFVYPRSGLLRLKKNTEQQRFNVLSDSLLSDAHKFETTTNAIVTVNTCEGLLSNSDWILAAYLGKDLRGIATSEKLRDDTYQYYISIHGEGVEKFNFKMLNVKTGKTVEIEDQLMFVKNALFGKTHAALTFNTSDQVDCDQFKEIENEITQNTIENNVYPNPFSTELTVIVPEEIGEQAVVHLIDQFGKIVFEDQVNARTKLFYNGAWLGKLSSGVYQLRLQNETNVIQYKLIKID